MRKNRILWGIITIFMLIFNVTAVALASDTYFINSNFDSPNEGAIGSKYQGWRDYIGTYGKDYIINSFAAEDGRKVLKMNILPNPNALPTDTPDNQVAYLINKNTLINDFVAGPMVYDITFKISGNSKAIINMLEGVMHFAKDVTDENAYSVRISNGGNYYQMTFAKLTKDDWHNVKLAYNSITGEVISLYVDGIQHTHNYADEPIGQRFITTNKSYYNFTTIRDENGVVTNEHKPKFRITYNYSLETPFEFYVDSVYLYIPKTTELEAAYPQSGTQEFASDETVKLTFNNYLDINTIEQNIALVNKETGEEIIPNISVDEKEVSFNLKTLSVAGKGFNVILKSGLKDLMGNSLSDTDFIATSFDVSALPPISVSQAVFSKDAINSRGSEIYTLENGLVSGEVVLTNNTNSPRKVNLYTVLYSKDAGGTLKMEKLHTSSANLEPQKDCTLTSGFYVEKASEYCVKLFMWDGMEFINPYSASGIIE